MTLLTFVCVCKDFNIRVSTGGESVAARVRVGVRSQLKMPFFFKGAEHFKHSFMPTVMRYNCSGTTAWHHHHLSGHSRYSIIIDGTATYITVPFCTILLLLAYTVHPSTLWGCTCLNFGDICSRGVCLHFSVMKLDGTLTGEHKAPEEMKVKNSTATSLDFFLSSDTEKYE